MAQLCNVWYVSAKGSLQPEDAAPSTVLHARTELQLFVTPAAALILRPYAAPVLRSQYNFKFYSLIVFFFHFEDANPFLTS